VQSRLSALTEELHSVKARLARLEGRHSLEVPEPATATASGLGDEAVSSGAWVALSTTPALVGRTLVVLGGAYFIRAITEAGVVPSGAGVVLGLSYAAWWLVRADHAAAVDDRPSAFFNVLASALIALPLVWETTARFGLLGPRAAQMVLVAYLAAGMVVARRHVLDAAATLLTLMALATAVALLASTHDLLAVTCSLLAIALGVEVVALDGRWVQLRVPTALTLDAVALLMVALVARPDGVPEGYIALAPRPALLAALAVPAVYLTSLATRTLLAGRQVTAFETTQTPLALLVGLGGAWWLLTAQRQPHGALVIAILVLGGLCYATAFLFAERRAGHAPNFYFYGTAAGVLTLVGTAASAAGTSLVLAGCALAIVAAVLGRQLDRWTLALHGSIYLLATAAGTGFLRGSIGAIVPAAVEPPGAGWTLAWGLMPVSLAVYAAVASAGRSLAPAWWSRLPQLLAVLVVIVGAAGVLTDGASAILGRLSLADGAVSATVGTAVLALLALVAAWAGARWALPELGWLVYPILVLGGFKLIAMDLRHGRAVTLFVSFVLYGTVLSVAPRLLRSRSAEP
jgi:hypothetical protein